MFCLRHSSTSCKLDWFNIHNFSLSSIAFGNVLCPWCDIAGGVFAFMSIVNLVRYCGANKAEETEVVEGKEAV